MASAPGLPANKQTVAIVIARYKTYPRDWSIFATDPDFKSYVKILSLKLHRPRN